MGADTRGLTWLYESYPYTVTTRLWNEPNPKHKAMTDPFMRHETKITLSWRDRIRVLFGRTVDLTVSVTADRDTMNAVMRLARTEDGDIVLWPQSDSTGPASVA